VHYQCNGLNSRCATLHFNWVAEHGILWSLTDWVNPNYFIFHKHSICIAVNIWQCILIIKRNVKQKSDFKIERQNTELLITPWRQNKRRWPNLMETSNDMIKNIRYIRRIGSTGKLFKGSCSLEILVQASSSQINKHGVCIMLAKILMRIWKKNSMYGHWLLSMPCNKYEVIELKFALQFQEKMRKGFKRFLVHW